jgi:flagellar protein FliL
MAQDQEQISEEQQEQPKKSKGKKLIFLALIVLVLGGLGGGAFYYFRLRSAAPAKQSAAKTKHRSAEHGGEPAEAEVKEVIELQPFIVNLNDKDDARYLRMTISLGIGETEGEEKPDPLFTTRIRNAILAIVTNKTSEQVLSVQGKEELRKEMLGAARGAAHKPEVLSIYITDFIVQM